MAHSCYMLAALQLTFIFVAVLYFLDFATVEPIQAAGYSIANRIGFNLKTTDVVLNSTTVAITSSTAGSPSTTGSRDTGQKTGLSGCPLPHFDPFDQSLKGYVNYRFSKTFRNCNPNFKRISSYEKGELKVWANTTLSCKARCFSQTVYHKKNEAQPWKSFTQKIKLDCEFAEIYCANPKNESDVQYAMLHSWLKPIKEKPKPRLTKNKIYNVYLIVLDSVGASAADRNLPLTMRYLEKSMQGVTFPYINKVGQNSRPNAIAMLLGKQIEDIDRILTGKPTIKADWNWDESCKTSMDNETSIFHNFSNGGYRTMITDDYYVGVLNYPNCVGWNTRVTDHTMDPFIHQTFGAPQKPNWYGSNCQFLHKEDLSYLKQFMDAYPDDPQFALTWVSEVVHDYNEGAMLMDTDLTTFFMENRKKLDDSFIFITADHGNRMSSIIWTTIGTLDIMNPMLIMTVPKDLRTPEILGTMKENAAKLQTHYDTRATILDILRHQPLSNYTDREPLKMEGEKGDSFLRKQVGERSCSTLPIPFTYCICEYKTEKVDVKADISVAAGKAVIDEVNKMLTEGKMTDKCNLWKYDKVVTNVGYTPVEETGSMKIAVAASWPYKEAKFSTLLHRSPKGEFTFGNIDRADKYGKRGSCAVGRFERLCDCKNNTST